MESDSNYSTIFPETFVHLTLPLGTASFSQMKMTKTRLRNRLTDVTLAKLMRIALEGPEQSDCIQLLLSLLLAAKVYCDLSSGGRDKLCSGGGGG